MNTNELETLDTRNKELANLISIAEQNNSLDRYSLKKEMYSNKIKMIEIITIAEKRAGITARELKRLVELRPKVPRYETGIKSLDDNLLGGIEIGTFVQLAGESGVGKTAITLEILTNIANYNKSVFFNFEMGDTRIVKRLYRLLENEQQWDNLIIDNDSRNLDTLCNEITLYARDGVKFFTIDSKMKIEVSGNKADFQKFSEISNRLAKLAQKLDIIVFLINQMSEDDLKNKRLAFKGSGDQKYDSDISLFYVMDEEGNRKLICSKNRQDERLFSIELHLDDNGKTVSNDTHIPVVQQYINTPPKKYIKKPTVTDYADSLSIEVL